MASDSTAPRDPKQKKDSFAVILPAAGRGQRAASEDSRPKQYQPIDGSCPLKRVIDCFLSHPRTGQIVIAINPADSDLFQQAVGPLANRVTVVAGGDSRQESIRNALEALAPSPPRIVLVHDAARPFLSLRTIDLAVAAAKEHGAAVPAIRLSDTIIETSDGSMRDGTLDRDRLRAVQTPQAFRFDALLAAHRAAAGQNRHDFTDDGALMAWQGHPVHIFEGDPNNVKLTTPTDMTAAEQRLALSRLLAHPDVRIGTGFDVHAFGPGDHVVLGGVAIPHGKALTGHSDADVALHALTDALLGAIGDGDIGTHFPPSDMRWKGADSAVFLREAVAKVVGRQGIVTHLDVTIICEAPKIGPYREAIRQRLAEITSVPAGRISVKATTTERLGFAGREEGIAALASVTVRLPFDAEQVEP